MAAGTAGASIVDVFSDIYTISYYYRSGGENTETATMMLVFVLLSLFLQLMLCVANHQQNTKAMLIAMSGTLTMTKMGIAFWNVLINSPSEAHVVLPPVSEMIFLFLCEVFAESIPMTVLQVQTILGSM